MHERNQAKQKFLGHAICVIDTELEKSDGSVALLFNEKPSFSETVQSSVAVKEAESMLKDTTIVINMAGVSSTDVTPSSREVLSTFFKNTFDTNIADAEVLSEPNSAQRRLSGQYDDNVKVEITIKKVVASQVTSMIDSLRASMETSQLGSTSIFVRSLRAMAEDTDVETFDRMVSATILSVSIVDPTEIVYHATMQVDVGIDGTPRPERTLAMRGACWCGSENESCDMDDALQQFEFRTDQLSSTIASLAQYVENVNTLDACIKHCEVQTDCTVLVYSETNDGLVEGEEHPRCAVFSALETLQQIPIVPHGNVRVRSKLNACPQIRVTQSVICYDQEDGTQRCSDLLQNYNKERHYMTQSSDFRASVVKPVTSSQVNELHLSGSDVVKIEAEACYAHDLTAIDASPAVLCADGNLEPFALLIGHDTSDCNSATRRNGTYPSMRLRCPRSAPLMCRYIHPEENDYRCVASVDLCNDVGGLKPCSDLSYDILGVPSFDTVPLSLPSGADRTDASR